MQGSATVHMAAPADKIWNLVADVRNIGSYSPEVFEAEWLDGASGPALGARFRGHVNAARQNGGVTVPAVSSPKSSPRAACSHSVWVPSAMIGCIE